VSRSTQKDQPAVSPFKPIGDAIELLATFAFLAFLLYHCEFSEAARNESTIPPPTSEMGPMP